MNEASLKKWQVKIFILCWLAYAIVYLGRVNLAIALPFIQHEFGWSKSQIGIISTVFFWVYGIGQLINGKLGDRISSRHMIFTGLLVAGIANMLFGVSCSILTMAVFWGLNGYFQSMLWGPIIKSLTKWFKNKDRGKTAVGMSFSMVLGYFLAWYGSGRLGDYAGWRWIFFIPAAVIIVFSVIWLIFFKNRPSDAGLVSPGETHNDEEPCYAKKTKLLDIIKNDKLWIVVIVCFIHGIIKEGIAIWSPMFFVENWGRPISEITGMIAFIPLANFAGIAFTGWLNKVFGYKEKHTLAALFALLVLAVAAISFLGNISLIFAVALVGVMSACMYGANTILLGIIPMNYSKHNRASSMAGFMDFVTYAAAGISAFITGVIIDEWGWTGMLAFWLAAAALGLLLSSIGNLFRNEPKTVLKDIDYIKEK